MFDMSPVASEVWNQVRHQAWRQVMVTVQTQVRSQGYEHFWRQVRGQVGDPANGQIGDQIREQNYSLTY